MCCPLDRGLGEFTVNQITFEKNCNGQRGVLIGTYNRSPKNLGERISRYFQRIELMEKVAEIADEVFHLCKNVLKSCSNDSVYQTLFNLHNGAHDIEHVLHSFCFIGDFSRICSGSFFLDSEGKKLNYLKSLSRIFHAVSHFFATMKFLNEHKLCPLQRFQHTFQYTSLIATIGYALWTASLLWERYHRKVNDDFKEDLTIHGAGGLFQALDFIGEVVVLSPRVDYVLSTLKSLAGIIHALFVVQRLMPSDLEKISTSHSLPNKKKPLKNSFRLFKNRVSHTCKKKFCKEKKVPLCGVIRSEYSKVKEKL